MKYTNEKYILEDQLRNKNQNIIVFVVKLEFPRNGCQFVWRKQITMLERGSSALKQI